MDANVISQLVATVGFPIAACIAMALFIKYVTDKFLAAVADMNEKHDNEIAAVKEVLAANTLAIEKMNQTLSLMEKRRVDDGK